MAENLQSLKGRTFQRNAPGCYTHKQTFRVSDVHEQFNFGVNGGKAPAARVERLDDDGKEMSGCGAIVRLSKDGAMPPEAWTPQETGVGSQGAGAVVGSPGSGVGSQES